MGTEEEFKYEGRVLPAANQREFSSRFTNRLIRLHAAGTPAEAVPGAEKLGKTAEIPGTLVYWNRCFTKVNTKTQSLVKKEQLNLFLQHRYRLHEYPDAIRQVMPKYPIF